MDASSTDQNTNKDLQRPKFQLCFSVKDPISSRSDIHRATIKLNGISTPIVTPKFYSLENTRLDEEDEKEIEKITEKLAKISDVGPREKYKEPLLESHSAGRGSPWGCSECKSRNTRKNIPNVRVSLKYFSMYKNGCFRYGWFQVKFIEKIPEIDRIDFPRKTSEMVKIQNLFSQFKAQIGDRCE